MFTQGSPLFRDPSIIRRTLTFTHLVRMIHSISPPAKPYIGSKFDAPLRIHPNIMTVETEWSKNMCRPWSLRKQIGILLEHPPRESRNYRLSLRNSMPRILYDPILLCQSNSF